MRSGVLILLLAACGDDPETALDLDLVPNPQLSSEADLVARLGTIVVVVDAAEGPLYPPGSERSRDGVQIKDADGDPSDLELIAVVPIPDDHLPRIRLTRGTLPDVPLHIRVLGRAQSEDGVDLARGGVTPVELVDGVTTPVTVPFNLLPAYLPLMVGEVAPADGDHLITCDENSVIQVMFSRAVEASTLLAAGRFQVDRLDVPAPVLPAGLEVDLAQAAFLPDQVVLDYRVRISSEVTDTAGVHLDQVPSMAGLQPYVADFHLTCGPGPMAPTPLYCHNGGTMCFTGYECRSGRCERVSCEGASCAAGFVCDPAVPGCQLDCRIYAGESCPPERPVCDLETGICGG